METNIDEFNQCAAIVLKQLYDSFPVPMKLDAWNVQEASETSRTLKTYADHPKGSAELSPDVARSLAIYRWTIQFLIHEGFIRDMAEERNRKLQEFHGNAPLNAPANPVFESLALTAKGLTMLNAMPKAIQGHPLTFIERISHALAEHSKQGVRETITALIAQTVTRVFF